MKKSQPQKHEQHQCFSVRHRSFDFFIENNRIKLLKNVINPMRESKSIHLSFVLTVVMQ